MTEQGGRENRHSFPFFFSRALSNNLSKKGEAFCVQATRRKGSDTPHLWKRIRCVQFLT